MQDKNLRSFASIAVLGDILISEPLVTNSDHADALKFSDVHCGTVVTSDILGGYEDCVDVNNGCSHLSITTGVVYPVGKYIATIKGGSNHITLQCLIKGDGMVDIGNWSDQSLLPTRGVKLEFHSPHGKRTVITVRVGNGEWPVCVGNVTFKKDYIGSLALKLYVFFKGLYLRKFVWPF